MKEYRCGDCNTCRTEAIGCGCDGAVDGGCFLCSPDQHKRPLCPPPPSVLPRTIWLIEWTNDGDTWTPLKNEITIYTSKEEAESAAKALNEKTAADVFARAAAYAPMEFYDRRKAADWQRMTSLAGDLLKLKRDLEELMVSNGFDVEVKPDRDQIALGRLMAWTAVAEDRHVTLDCDPDTKVWRVSCSIRRDAGSTREVSGTSMSLAEAADTALSGTVDLNKTMPWMG